MEGWETEADAVWLRLLTLAVLNSFGLRQHVGAVALSDFLKLIRIDTHAGFSPGALRTQLRQMEALLPAFQQSCEASPPRRRLARRWWLPTRLSSGGC